MNDNILKIKEMFPNCVTECKDKNGETKLGVNFELLKQELSDDIIGDGEEKYEFNWPGKKKSIILANTPSENTLRPCKEESVNWDTTQNLYIEGDNLEVLKILRSTYLHKVKLIYIDPPYNTGKDFIYKDNYKKNEKEYLCETNQIDEDGNHLVQNKETNGRFHSDWLNMMYPRLKLARDLLTSDGVIFISIDEHEQANLKQVVDEIFGVNNFINIFMWLHGKGKKDAWSRTLVQYVIAYAKDKRFLRDWSEKSYTNYQFTNPDNDPKGKWFSGSLSFDEDRSNPHHPNYYSITSPTGKTWTRQWQINENKMYELIKQGDISWGNPITCDGVPRKKIRPSTIDIIPKNIFENVGTTRSSEKDLKKLMNCNCFNNPKTIELIKHIVNITNLGKNDIILDFFSGSATTAHAVMQLNAEDDGNRKFIMVQLPEPCDEKSEAFKSGYKNICEIGKERIRRAGKKIIEETGKTDLDIGFRVLKLDSSNMRNTYYLPQEYSISLLKDEKFYKNIKEDRTPEDLVFQDMLESGILLSSPIKEEIIDGKRFFNVNNNECIYYFEDNLTEDLIEKVLDKKSPRRFVTRDSSINDDILMNVEPLIEVYNPKMIWKVI